MALSSSSTVADALAQYNDNLSWEGDITAATAALAAVRWLLANRPKVIATNDRNIDFESLAAEKKMLEQFASNFSTSVNRTSFTRGHMLK